MSTVIALVNTKPGVGKTTSAVWLSYAFARGRGRGGVRGRGPSRVGVSTGVRRRPFPVPGSLFASPRARCTRALPSLTGDAGGRRDRRPADRGPCRDRPGRPCAWPNVAVWSRWPRTASRSSAWGAMVKELEDIAPLAPEHQRVRGPDETGASRAAAATDRGPYGLSPRSGGDVCFHDHPDASVYAQSWGTEVTRARHRVRQPS